MPTASTAVLESSGPHARTEIRALAIGLVLVAAAFAATWPTFPAVWLENRSHGFLAAALAGWFVWTRRSDIGHVNRPLPVLLPVVAALSFLWLAGQIMSAQVVSQFALLALLGTFVVTVNGSLAGRALGPAAAALALALPIWEVLTWPLQLIATVIGGTVVKLLGVDAVIKDETITVQWGQFVVADSCSGLGFFLTAVTLGLSYALMFTKSSRARWRIVALAALSALVANWIRVIGLVLIGNATRMQSSLMQDHELFGWVIFGAAMMVFFMLASRIERRYPQDTGAQTTTLPHTSERRPSWLVPVATVCAVAGPLLLYGVRLQTNAPVFAPVIGGIVADARWIALPTVPSSNDARGAVDSNKWEPQFVGQSSHEVHLWHQGVDTIRVDRVVYTSERQGAELVGAGSQVAADSIVLAQRLVGPLDQTARTARQVVVREGKRARVIWGWYRVAGMETSSAGKAKLMSLLAFLKRQEGGEGVFVSTPCDAGDCSKASARLFQFVTGRELPSAEVKPQGAS
ncbi:MAG: exosortase [Gemmatimonadaceae bacterium]|nr:exosortase [Gemmatimonadaceae bacterium]